MAAAITGRGGAPMDGQKPAGGRFRASREAKLRAALAAGAVCAVLCGTFLFLGFREYLAKQDMELEWEEISCIAGAGGQEQVPLIEVPAGQAGPQAPAAAGADAVPAPSQGMAGDLLYKAVDLPALQALNPYVSGYVHIPGTRVDYPVMKEVAPGDYYYIDHNMYGKKDKYGAVFELCDEERGEESPITWIFGHHMASGSMFSDLYKYLDQEFGPAPAYLYRDGFRTEYVPFGCCVVDMEDGVYDFGAYSLGSEAYARLLDRLEGSNRLSSGGPWAGADEPILVLSTCYGSAGTRERIIVLYREGRKAVAPDYYRTLQEAEQYGGSRDGVQEDEVPEGSSVGGDEGGAPQGGGPGTGPGTAFPGYGDGMMGLGGGE